MLDVLFRQVLSCSFIGSYVIIAIMVARLFLKKSPRIYSYALWSVVYFRLLVPFTLESPFGILPETQGILPMNQEKSTISQEKETKQVSTAASSEIPFSSMEVQGSVQNATSVWSILWCMGMSVLVIPSLCSVVKLHKKLKVSARLEKNIYLVDSIDTPFVWGLLKPKIYLPSTLNEEEKECVVPHEEYHLKRFDQLTRLLAFFTLILHWFNPLVWCAFVLSGRDMELSVDEKVIKNLVQERPNTENESTIKQKYATLLLELGTKKSSYVPLYVTPTFQYGETRERVNHVMKMKKTKLWVSGLSAMLVMGLAVGFTFHKAEETTLDQYGLPYVELHSTLPSGQYVDNYVAGLNFGVPEELNGTDRLEELYTFLDTQRVWRDELQQDLGEPKHIDLFLRYENGTTTSTYAGFYTDDNGVKQAFSEEKSYPFEVSNDLSAFTGEPVSAELQEIYNSESFQDFLNFENIPEPTE